MSPTRELYWNIDAAWLLYPLFIPALAVCARGTYRHIARWRLGRPANRREHIAVRIRKVLNEVLTHKNILRDLQPGITHFLIFWGIIILAIGTLIVALRAGTGIDLMHGTVYLYVMCLGLDVAGMMVLIGLGLALYRRNRNKTDQPDREKAETMPLLLAAAVVVSGFVVEGLRIGITRDPWASWSPVGSLFAACFSGADEDLSRSLHRIFWWMHVLLSFGMLAILPASKLIHVVTAPLNILFGSLQPKGGLPFIDMQQENTASFGVAAIRDFTWKDLMDADACTCCGRCQDHCPAHLSGKNLSPKDLIHNIKRRLCTEESRVARGNEFPSCGSSRLPAAFDEIDGGKTADQSLVGKIVSEDGLWSCTTCRSCMEQCPSQIEHLPKLIGLRRNQVLMRSIFPQKARTLFKNTENTGNPWGAGRQARADWAKKLNVRSIADGWSAEYLYWPGCAGAFDFDERNASVTAALVKLLQAADVSFVILGNEERCCGDSVRRIGNEYLYYSLAEKNIAVLKHYGVRKIITQCPHCYNTLKNDYAQLGGRFEVQHHTEFLFSLLLQGKLGVRRPGCARVTYHDSCYLGRHNEIFNEPRKVLEAAGVLLVEMDRRRERSFCCGGGGGRFWLEEQSGKHMNDMRIEQAVDSRAAIVSTSCPFCLTMLNDAAKRKETDIAVLDVAEILARSL